MEENNIKQDQINNMPETNNETPNNLNLAQDINFTQDNNEQISVDNINPPVVPIVEPQTLEAPIPNIVENVQQPVPNDLENGVKTSGTVSEAELFIDATKPEAEVIDEYEIKKNVATQKNRYKRNITFIVIVVVIIVAFIVALPFIVKWIGF